MLSEQCFESFCGRNGITYGRIEEGTEPRPDYEMEISGQPILAELKQFDPNAEELAALERQALGEAVVLGPKPGERLRRVIREGNRQLRSLRATRPWPTLLVAYNNTPCSLHTDSYAVMTAMQGLDVIDVEVPTSPAEAPRFGLPRSGLERAMQPRKNTSTSAVAILRESLEDEIVLVIYHNRYAAHPLEPDTLRLPGIFQYRLPDGAVSSVGTRWVPV
jgi:hypothetical protein